jgi:hypothetical protein
MNIPEKPIVCGESDKRLNRLFFSLDKSITFVKQMYGQLAWNFHAFKGIFYSKHLCNRKSDKKSVICIYFYRLID